MRLILNDEREEYGPVNYNPIETKGSRIRVRIKRQIAYQATSFD